MTVLRVPKEVSKTEYVKIVGTNLNSNGSHNWYKCSWGLAMVHDPTKPDDYSGRQFDITKQQFTEWGGVL